MIPLNSLCRKKGSYLAIFLIYSALLAACSLVNSQMATPVLTPSPKPEAKKTASAFIEPVTTKYPAYVYNQIVTLLSNFDPDLNDVSVGAEINLNNDFAFFDFDKGEITTAASADIYLYVGCGSDCFNTVIAINGATSILWLEGTELGYEGCRIALEGEKKAAGVNIVPGEYSCLLTNEGNVVQIVAIENEALSKDAKFVFGYIIWY